MNRRVILARKFSCPKMTVSCWKICAWVKKHVSRKSNADGYGAVDDGVTELGRFVHWTLDFANNDRKNGPATDVDHSTVKPLSTLCIESEGARRMSHASGECEFW
jgi:hypothetical protein